MEDHLKHIRAFINEISELPLEERIEALNSARRELHEHSPFKSEPVDCVEWVQAECVNANDYNPNSVASPEMKLLELSINADGYTQPIVTHWNSDSIEIVDGFHRSKVGKACETVRKRTLGYVPVTRINDDREGRNDRIAATIRHNRARGKHAVGAMSEIVLELSRRNWSNKKIGRELGMDEDEVLRLRQIGGIADTFSGRDFSEAWEIDEEVLCETQS